MGESERSLAEFTQRLEYIIEHQPEQITRYTSLVHWGHAHGVPVARPTYQGCKESQKNFTAGVARQGKLA